MDHESNSAYNLRREKAERLAAERAAIPAARNVHSTLADRYAAIARSQQEETL